MSYIRIKWIKGNPYLYEQASYRVGKKVKTKHIRYIGRFGFVPPSGGHRGGFPLFEKISQDHKEHIDNQIARLRLNNYYPYEREILRQCLYKHHFPLKIGVAEAPDLRGNLGYVEHTKFIPTKVTEFALRTFAPPFTWMHELGHMLEFGDHIVDDEIRSLRTDFIDQVLQSLAVAVRGGIAEKEAFIKQYAPLMDLRDDFKIQYVKARPLSERAIYIKLEQAKSGEISPTEFTMHFLHWVYADKRLRKPQEIFADTVASLIVNPKRAFDVHTTAGKKYVSKVYVKLFSHLEEKYKISLGRPKKTKEKK